MEKININFLDYFEIIEFKRSEKVRTKGKVAFKLPQCITEYL